MSSPLTRMLDELIAREGGYVNHPADRGGPTKYGITEQVARAYGFEGDMRDLPRNQAESIYKTRYWFRPGFDGVCRQGFPRLAEELFDTGVNMGPRRATEFLQRSLNVLLPGPTLEVDGDIGPVTLNALRRLGTARSDAEEVLLRAVDGLQAAYYIALAERRPSQEAFAYGWLRNRIGNVR